MVTVSPWRLWEPQRLARTWHLLAFFVSLLQMGWAGQRGTSSLTAALLPQKSRYGTYAALLRVKLKAGSEELDAVEAAVAQASGTEDEIGRAHV